MYWSNGQIANKKYYKNGIIEKLYKGYNTNGTLSTLCSFKKVKNKYILKIECQKSEKPIWMNEKEFFVRADPSTEKLEGPNLVEYIKTRFKE